MDFTRFAASWSPRLLSVLRIVSSLLFLQHGTAKLFSFPHDPRFDKLEFWSLVGVGGLIEIIGGLLLLVGLYTRPVAFILSGEMAFAYFLFHAPQNIFPLLNKGELAALYCFVFLYFSAAGGGPWSLDHRRKASR
jgi:putative oxidoreductase